jgi:hypothetical protein
LGLERIGDSIARRERWLRRFERTARRSGLDLKPRDPSDLLTLGSVDQPKVDPKLVAGLACTALQKNIFHLSLDALYGSGVGVAAQ